MKKRDLLLYLCIMKHILSLINLTFLSVAMSFAQSLPVYHNPFDKPVLRAVDEAALPLYVPVPPTYIGQGRQFHDGTVLKVVHFVLLRLVEGLDNIFGVAEG